MKLSLNLIKKYVDIPSNITAKQLAYDLTLRTVEVESLEYTKEKFHDIVVGKILEIKKHPNADLLKVCITDIGESEPVQIVCGGDNLYEGEYVVVSKPGALVYWHGEGELVKIKETNMRGVSSYGMICGATEVYLDKLFPPTSEKEIVDLKDVECEVGQNIADVIYMDDYILEIDNKSLTNRPDLWCCYGIARELSAIYDVPLKELPTYPIDKGIKEYKISIDDSNKCRRYVGIEMKNVYKKSSPLWMQSALINSGMRPINAIVDITNYVMIAMGQPLHAFDATHVDGEEIIVRNAHKDEKLLLIGNNVIDLNESDLVIADKTGPLALAGIRGGKKDSILDTTTNILLEVANFTASTIRNSQKRFNEKTDASIRYEKNLDTCRVDDGISLSLQLFKEIFPEIEIISYMDNYPVKTERNKIVVDEEFLNVRLGDSIPVDKVINILSRLGYDVNYNNGKYDVVVPVWRSTGDVSIKDDVMGDIARILSYDSFEPKPLPVNFTKAVLQQKVSLERKLREYLSFRCGFNEIFTYPWISDKYILAANLKDDMVQLATPPAPDLVNLRSSLIPGLLEAVHNNSRYYNEFKIYEMAQVFEKGEYHETCDDETLPIHKKLLSGAVVGKNAKELFYEVKGVIENMASYCQMKNLTFKMDEKPSWADINGYLNIILDNKLIGNIGLLSMETLKKAKIKFVNVAIFELNVDMLKPNLSRTNEYIPLPQLPLVEKDLSLIMDETVTWQEICNAIKNKVNDLEFIEEYNGSQIPDGKKSIMLRIKFENKNDTMTNEEITTEMNKILDILKKKCNVELREI